MKREMRRLETKWQQRSGWPKFLEWIEIAGVRGWTGQKISFDFPITAIVGENGAGKTTVLQSAACVYKATSGRTWYPSEFFPETAWDKVKDVRIRFGYKQGPQSQEGSIRKPSSRWLGQPQRPDRLVSYLGLDRLQPIGTRVGYARIAKNKHQEKSTVKFDQEQLSRLSNIMGRSYDEARISKSNIDGTREIPVLTRGDSVNSGFHHGAGEVTTVEFLKTAIKQNSLVLIDEIESSLHPRMQRRLMRDLAVIARDKECQFIISTHSPYILDELPMGARLYVNAGGGSGSEKDVLVGVSAAFSMTKMDDEDHPECEIFVEDNRAATFIGEILSRHAPEYFTRCIVIPYGTANLGVALGQLKAKFTKATVIFLDGDQGQATGCVLLPGDDAPERVVFEELKTKNWLNVPLRIGRGISDVADHCTRAMTLRDHHDWIPDAANHLRCGGDVLWQAMCSEWAEHTPRLVLQPILDAIGDSLP